MSPRVPFYTVFFGALKSCARGVPCFIYNAGSYRPVAKQCCPVPVSNIAPSPDLIMIAMRSPTMMFRRRLIFAPVLIINIEAALPLQYLLLGIPRREVTCAIMFIRLRLHRRCAMHFHFKPPKFCNTFCRRKLGQLNATPETMPPTRRFRNAPWLRTRRNLRLSAGRWIWGSFHRPASIPRRCGGPHGLVPGSAARTPPGGGDNAPSSRACGAHA